MSEILFEPATWIEAGADLLSVTELFHRVNNLIPDNQDVISIPPDTLVRKAIRIMQENRFSQLPVKEGKEVLGVFSYRVFATHVANTNQSNFQYGELHVSEFIEPLRYVTIRDDLEFTFEYLNWDDAVLVGHETDLQGIVTVIDVLKYLYDVASPFVIIGEIELTLRRLIHASIQDSEMPELIDVCNQKLKNSGTQDHQLLPSTLGEMSFKHYELFISMNWPRFEDIFGNSPFQRKITKAKLNKVGELRNVVFHFKRELTPENLKTLSDHRFWLLSKAKSFQERRAANYESIN